MSVVALGLAPSLPLAVAAAALAGAAQATFMALSIVLVQAVLPDELRGRVISLYVMMAAGVMAVMILANGAAADVVSVRVLLIGPAVVYVVLLLGWSVAAPQLRGIYREGALRSVPDAVSDPAG